MPYAPALPCSVPRCPNRQPCPDHVKRDERTGRGYGRKWRKFKARYWAKHGRKCVHCFARGIIEEATELDHVTPISGPSDPKFFNESAVQGLCGPCHRRKTAEERKQGLTRMVVR